MDIIRRILNSFVLWGAWIIIPVIMEIIPSLGSVFLLLKRRGRMQRKTKRLDFYPEISIIVPVYNSKDTLFSCIASIHESTYPNEDIHILLVNNQGQDDSFSVYADCQRAFPGLRMQWLEAEQGKSRALNLALHNSEGKYIINLDSDGTLEPHALENMVAKFEVNPGVNCMTGAILTDPKAIKKERRHFRRLLQNLEFMEYAQAFLAGRSYASEMNAVYTLSGAFSAFRKSVVLKSWMYNTDTICEDTHITFQMRYLQKERVEICENAIFFVDPIESVNRLYTQRQRWQRGSLEVAHMFRDKHFRLTGIFRDVNVQTMVYDHTFAFPRLIWYLALFCLVNVGYSGRVVFLSTAAIYALYVLIGYFYFLTVTVFLRSDKKLCRYYAGHWWCVLLLPVFNLMVFFTRVIGIVNSIQTDSSWRTSDLSGEWRNFCAVLREDAAGPIRVIRKLRRAVNIQSR
jgi:putative glycosyltransferase (exosortase G-associated)